MIHRLIEPLLHPQGLLIAAANLVPLLGVFLAGWDASTIVILYWLETAVIGFWTIVRVIIAPGDVMAVMPEPKPRTGGGLGLGLFILAHAGLFMTVHLFFLTSLMPGEWRSHLGNPMQFLYGFIIPSGLWLPLAGLFLVRGIINASEIESGRSAGTAIFGFYIRIVVMQFVILLGGMASALAGSQVLLALLIVLKTLIDLHLSPLVASVQQKLEEARQSRSM